MRDRLGEHAGSEKGDLTGPNPVDRGKYGSEIPPIRSRRGRRRRKPGKLHAYKGYGYARLRRWLHEQGITHRIARKGVESSQRLGRRRWTVERARAWLAGCRRLHRRYERTANHFLAFTRFACTLICCRRLTK